MGRIPKVCCSSRATSLQLLGSTLRMHSSGDSGSWPKPKCFMLLLLLPLLLLLLLLVLLPLPLVRLLGGAAVVTAAAYPP